MCKQRARHPLHLLWSQQLHVNIPVFCMRGHLPMPHTADTARMCLPLMSSQHDFMAESCPRACGFCANGGLLPTPAVFQLDFVCKNELAVAPQSLKRLRDETMPDGCAFRCRDNMTVGCEAAAESGACEKHADVMRFQCPASCGVCKALDFPPTEETYPKYACERDEGDDPQHAGKCANWAKGGEVCAA